MTTEVETDEEVVSDPVFGAPAYAGANRTLTITGGTSSEDNAVKTYYTIDGTDPTSSSTEYTGAITITEECNVKAITISTSTGVSSNVVASGAISVGKLTLNAPSLSKTAYSDGNYTVSITSNQASLAFVPGATTIKYTIGSGSEQTYSSPFTVPAGSTVTAYVEATDYNNSASSELETGIQPNLPTVWSQNYAGIVESNININQASEGSAISNGILSNAGAGYYVYSSDGTSATTNANAGFQVYYNAKSPRAWMIRPAGMYSNGSGATSVAIANLKDGEIIKVTSSTALTAGSNLTRLDNISYANTWFFEATADGNGYFSMPRFEYVYTIEVLSPVVTATITAAGYATFSSTYPVDFTSVAGLKTYKATACDGSKVTMEEVTGAVAANTGLVLKGAADTYSIPVAASGTAVDGNLLEDCDCSWTTLAVANFGTNYVLSVQGGKVVWAPVTDGDHLPTMSAGQAYLYVPDGSARALTMVFDDDLTGINSVKSDDTLNNGTVYNLNGQRVAQPTKGLYIMGGKKVIVK